MVKPEELPTVSKSTKFQVIKIAKQEKQVKFLDFAVTIQAVDTTFRKVLQFIIKEALCRFRKQKTSTLD